MKAVVDAGDLAERIAGDIRDLSLGLGGLPPMRALAERYGVSRTSVWRALGKLRREGRLPRPEREGARGSSAPVTGAADAARQARYPRLAARLRAELSEGMHPEGQPLPVLKRFQARYGCAYETLAKAFAAVEREGLVERRGGRYYPARPREVRRGEARVHLAGERRVLQGLGDHALTLVTALEKRLEALEWGELKFYLADGADADRSRPPAPERVAGYVYIMHGPDGPWLDFFRQRPGLPVVVISQEGCPSWRTFHPLHPRMRLIRTDNLGAGREVGQALAALGHRRAAFLTHQNLEMEPGSWPTWTQLRLQGLREALGGNEYVTLRQVPPSWGPPSGLRAEAEPGLSALARHAGEGKYLPSHAAKAWLRPAYRLANAIDMGRSLEPLFRAALGEGGATAWVCLNDEMALLALAFLERNGVRVPDDLSVVGFDNSPAALGAGLSSYTFHYDRMGHLAVEILARTDWSSRARPPSPWVVGGQLIPRASMGPAPGRGGRAV